VDRRRGGLDPRPRNRSAGRIDARRVDETQAELEVMAGPESVVAGVLIGVSLLPPAAAQGLPSPVHEIVTGGMARVDLGVFEVFVPASTLEDEKDLRSAARAMLALLEAQAGWSEWVGAQGEDPERAKTLERWLRGLEPRHFSARRVAGDALELVPAGGGGVRGAIRDPIRDAIEEERHFRRAGPAMGTAREIPAVPLVIFPERSEFVARIRAAGSAAPELRASAFDDGVETWLEYQAGDVRLLCLEYGVEGSGRSVAEGNPSALPQLAAQVGIRSFLDRAYPASLDPAFRSALANALVIDVYGELDTRIDGDVRARSTEGRSTFVPGGNPSGGALPPVSAQNRWRESLGKDHFVGVLARIQAQSGKKRARAERLASFELVSDEGALTGLAQAPFLGATAAAPRAELLPDYLEFLRCYGIAFVRWLRLEGAGRDSSARFAALLWELGGGSRADDLPALLGDLYGQPLSAARLSELFKHPTLEGRFLTWLSKAR
jgi:hypothetical protein